MKVEFKIFVVLLLLFYAGRNYIKWHDEKSNEMYWGHDVAIYYHAVLGNDDWFEPNPAPESQNVYIYGPGQKVMFFWMRFFPTEESIIAFMFALNIICSCYMVWKSSDTLLGGIIAILCIKIFVNLLIFGNIAIIAATLGTFRRTAFFSALFKPNALGCYFLHTAQREIGSRHNKTIR